MSRTLARCAALVGTAVAVAAVSVTGGAQAAPAQPGGLPAGLVAALQRDLQMSPQEFLSRASAAQEVAGFASGLRSADPSAVGGAWLDADGAPTVAVTTQAAADRVAAAGYRAERVPLATSGWDGRPVGPQQRSAPRPPLRVAVGVTPVGGDAYITTDQPLADASGFMVCSFGFMAADKAGNPLALSAGHCDPNRPAAGTASAAQVYEPNFSNLRGSPAVGRFRESGIGDTGGNLDYSVIGVTPGASAGLVTPAVRGADGATMPVTGAAVPVAGAPVCKSGQTSGYTCGTVLETVYDTELAGDAGETWNVHGFTTSACTLAGDSGGAIVTGTLALGITSGSSVSNAGSCAAAASSGVPVMSFGIAVRDVLARVNRTAGVCVALRTEANPAGVSTDPACVDAPVPGGSGSLSLGSS